MIPQHWNRRALVSARVREVLLILGTVPLLIATTLWEGQPGRAGLPFLVGVSLGVCLPLLLRRRLPVTVAVLSAFAALLGGVIPGWPGRFVAMAAMCSMAYLRPWRLRGLLAVSLGWVLGFGALAGRTEGLTSVADLLVFSFAPIVTGYALRLQRDRAEQSARLHDAEHRAQLAREVHDSVGHHLTAIRMQAVAARRAIAGQPPTADRALGTIRDLASSALSEVRDLLGVLREGRAGLAEVERLAEQLSGPDRRITVRGLDAPLAVPLPAAVDHTAYRVVQEAMTNAVRHSTATEVQVQVRCDRGRVVVEVADNGSLAAPVAEGQGIRGMRERVSSLGGDLSINALQPHGCLVKARLPVAPA